MHAVTVAPGTVRGGYKAAAQSMEPDFNYRVITGNMRYVEIKQLNHSKYFYN